MKTWTSSVSANWTGLNEEDSGLVIAVLEDLVHAIRKGHVTITTEPTPLCPYCSHPALNCGCAQNP